jgi:hypothetical protein
MGRPIEFTSGASRTQHFSQINEDMYQLDFYLGIRAIPPSAGCREFHALPPGCGAVLSAVSQSTYAQNAQCPDQAQEWAQIGPNLGRHQRQTAQRRCSALSPWRFQIEEPRIDVRRPDRIFDASDHLRQRNVKKDHL